MAVLVQQQQQQAAAAQAAAAIARLSVDGRGSVDAASAAAAAATTKAMLQAAGANALPPRMSLDSLLATRQPSGGWAPAPAPGNTTAAAALVAGVSSLPLNEQPFPTGNAPRMSNAGQCAHWPGSSFGPSPALLYWLQVLSGWCWPASIDPAPGFTSLACHTERPQTQPHTS
jgi:hypothetical protein